MNGNSQLQVGYFFPTAIGICVDLLPSEALHDLQLNCRKLRSNTANSENGNWLSNDQSPFNTMTTYNIIDDANFDPLRIAVDSKVKEFALHHADIGDYISDHAWLNVYEANQYQEAHTHSAPYIYSAVFYVEASEGSGLFVAQAPYIHARIESNSAGNNILNDAKRWFEPQPNMLIVFNSTLSHYTTPNHGNRSSIAFNYKPI